MGFIIVDQAPGLLDKSVIRNTNTKIIFKLPDLEDREYELEEFLQIVKDHPDLLAVSVEKERFGYMVNDTICEYANVWINGAMTVTVNSESTEIDDIKKTIKDLELEGVENINYLQAAKRITGINDKKLAN